MYMGGDSAGVSGLDITVRSDVKVFKNGPMLFGYTSSFRMGQLLRFKLKIPKNTCKDDYEYMCTTFVDAVREVFKDNGYSHVNNNEETGGTFLVAYKGKIYSVQNDFQVGMSMEEYDSCGCGKYYALGSLDSTRFNDFGKVHTIKIPHQVNTALMVAAYRSGGVRAPFIVIDKGY